MKKIGLLYPGQGSQYIGMGKELANALPVVRQTLDTANGTLGFDLTAIMFEGPEETLRQTQYTQPAIFAFSIALFRALTERFSLSGHEITAAGHSLGEYSALGSAGVFSFEDGLRLVKARGEYIQEASSRNPGTMAAIIGLERSKLEELCAESASLGVCQPVNFNSPGQIVIAGTVPAVQDAVKRCEAAGATKAILLNVSGPFHSSLMTPASEMMGQELKKFNLKNPVFPVITNCDAAVTTDAVLIPEKLARQINSPVLWEDTIRRMITSGVETFIEVGPQRVLSGLLRRIDKTRKSLNIEDVKSLDKTVQELSQ